MDWSPQRGQMVRRMPVSPVHSHTFLHSTVLQHIPNTECHVDVTVRPTTVPLRVHHVPVCPSMDPTCLTLDQSSPHQLGTAPLIINSSDCHKFDEHQLHLKWESLTDLLSLESEEDTNWRCSTNATTLAASSPVHIRSSPPQTRISNKRAPSNLPFRCLDKVMFTRITT